MVAEVAMVNVLTIARDAPKMSSFELHIRNGRV